MTTVKPRVPMGAAHHAAAPRPHRVALMLTVREGCLAFHGPPSALLMVAHPFKVANGGAMSFVAPIRPALYSLTANIFCWTSGSIPACATSRGPFRAYRRRLAPE